MDAIAIDFETANEARGSACAMGLAWIENSRVTRVEERLIRPKELRFAGMNVAIHGITADDVADEPEFPDVLAEFLPDLRGSLVLAHNASFDIGVMRSTLDMYGLPYPEFSYLCTVKVARSVWPDLSSGSLPVVANRLGIRFLHHQAGGDACACGEVALAATRHLKLTSIADLPSKLSVTLGRISANGYSPCSAKRSLRALERRASVGEPGHRFYGRSVAFTGTLAKCSRFEAAQKVIGVGGLVHSNVRSTTDFVIVSNEQVALADAGSQSRRFKQAKALIERGKPTIILFESEFYEVLGLN